VRPCENLKLKNQIVQIQDRSPFKGTQLRSDPESQKVFDYLFCKDEVSIVLINA